MIKKKKKRLEFYRKEYENVQYCVLKVNCNFRKFRDREKEKEMKGNKGKRKKERGK